MCLLHALNFFFTYSEQQLRRYTKWAVNSEQVTFLVFTSYDLCLLWSIFAHKEEEKKFRYVSFPFPSSFSSTTTPTAAAKKVICQFFWVWNILYIFFSSSSAIIILHRDCLSTSFTFSYYYSLCENFFVCMSAYVSKVCGLMMKQTISIASFFFIAAAAALPFARPTFSTENHKKKLLKLIYFWRVRVKALLFWRRY